MTFSENLLVALGAFSKFWFKKIIVQLLHNQINDNFAQHFNSKAC
jgi:hypothetical protein